MNFNNCTKISILILVFLRSKKSLVKRSGPGSVLAPNINPQHQQEKGLNSFPLALSSSQPLPCSFFLLDPPPIMITGQSSIPRKLLFLSPLCIPCPLLDVFSFLILYAALFFDFCCVFQFREMRRP